MTIREQNAKAGYVYVHLQRWGLRKRYLQDRYGLVVLEPMDRISELGDAFGAVLFDVHANGFSLTTPPRTGSKVTSVCAAGRSTG